MDTTSFLRRSSAISTLSTTSTEAMSPSMVSRSRTYSIDSMDSFDEEYFDRTYIPLSNLPTPPLSTGSNASSRRSSGEEWFTPSEYLNPQFLGPAIHLTNLIPSAVSLTPSTPSLTQAILSRADLPYETIALAVCILDSLNSRFALSFRQSFPLAPSTTKSDSKPTFLSPFSSENTPQQQSPPHIDSIHPEIIPLAALILSVKFLDDDQQSTRHYVEEWGRGIWTCEQVNYAQRSLMDNLGGRLLPLWNEDVIMGAMRDMERAGKIANVQKQNVRVENVNALCGKDRSKMSDGKAVLNAYYQLTPGDSPALGGGDGKQVVEQRLRILGSIDLIEGNLFPLY